MKNSTILFLAALLILGWFGAEVYTAQNICVTTCIDLSGLNAAEQAIAVAVLPVILVVGAIRLRKSERSAPTGSTNDQNKEGSKT